MLPVGSHRRQILTLELTPLGKQPSQVSPLCQGVAVNRLVDTIAAHLVVVVADGSDVDALAGVQTNVPVVAGHARDDVVAGQMPGGRHVGVLNPDIRILLGEFRLADGILYEDAGMGFAVQVHYLALVADKILYSECRRYHLARRAEMIELPTRQRQDSHTQGAQLSIVNRGVGTQ